jgi:RNA polymerase-interacting CarD/CdnL/TRCF family regulator
MSYISRRLDKLKAELFIERRLLMEALISVVQELDKIENASDDLARTILRERKNRKTNQENRA